MRISLLVLLTFSLSVATAQDDRVEICYAVADRQVPGNVNRQPDYLIRLRPDGTGLSIVGQMGTERVEAIALNRTQNRLYATNGSTLGTIDTTTGQFQRIGRAVSCESPNGTIGLNDLDALAWDPSTGDLWAVERIGTPVSASVQTREFLVRIDAATGQPADGTCRELTGDAAIFDLLTEIDALTFAPDGRVLATANSGGGRRNRLVSIDLATGVMTNVGPTVIDDVEGLHYTESGRLIGTTGVDGDPAESNSLIQVNDLTGQATFIGVPRLLEIPLNTGSVTSDIEDVSCRLEPPGVIENPSIDLEKATNGEDADDPPGPSLRIGDEVTWTYVVTNDGDVDLVDVLVSDNQEGTICEIPALAAGASETCTATGVAVKGQYANVASVIGSTAGDQQLSDTDPSHYLAEGGVDPTNPAVRIEKSTNGMDADLPPGPALEVGDSVTWEYVVSNIGDVRLVDLTVSDDLEGFVCTLAELAPGASASCSLAGIAVEGLYSNVGSVAGSSEGGDPVSDSDPSNYTATEVVVPGNPAIDVEKATNGEDADVAPGPEIDPGAVVTWTYVVTNTGDEMLINVTVTDDLEGAVCRFDTLDVDESQTCELIGTATIGQYENVATAAATGSGGTPVSDEDPSHYIGAVVVGPGTPAIDLEKLTNGVDADLGPGPRLEIGSTVEWTYLVTNVGDLDLTNVTVVDDIEGSVCVLPELAVGTQRECNLTGTAIGGEYRNVATASGTATNDETVTDTDPSHYIAATLTNGDPAVDIEKFTNGIDADLPPGPELLPGSDVVWTYIVSNVGEVALVNVRVTDDREGNVCVIEQMDPGEQTTCSLSGIVREAQYANVGTVEGEDGNGTPVTDSDPSHYSPPSVSGPPPPPPPGGGPTVPVPVDQRWALLLLALGLLYLGRRRAFGRY